MPLISTENKRYLQGQARRERYEQYKEALQYCKDNGCGAKAAIKTGQWNDVQVQACKWNDVQGWQDRVVSQGGDNQGWAGRLAREQNAFCHC
jgi:hypothetical protein